MGFQWDGESALFFTSMEAKMHKDKVVSARVDGVTAKELEEYAKARGHVKVNTSVVVRELISIGLRVAKGQGESDG